MNRATVLCDHKIDKKLVSTLTIFAINNIPETDEYTLTKFLELMHVSGSFGSITVEEMAKTMGMLTKYIPGVQITSLVIVVDLLTIHVPLKLDNQDRLLIASGQLGQQF